MAWDDVKNMLEEEVMTEASLKGAWKEAAKGRKYSLNDNYIESQIHLKSRI